MTSRAVNLKARLPALAGLVVPERLLVLAKLLVWGLPPLFLLGRAPADIALSLAGVLFLLRSAVAQDWRWLRTPWVAIALLLWLYLVLSSPFALDPWAAFERAIPWVRYPVFAAALQHWVLTAPADRRMLLASLGLVLGFAVAEALVQFFTGTSLTGRPWPLPNRLGGPFNDPAVGTFLAKMAFPVLGGLLAWAVLHGRAALAPALAAIIVLGVTILLSGERMAFLLYWLGLLLLVAFAPAARRALLTAAAVLAVLCGAILVTDAGVSRRMVTQTSEQVGLLPSPDAPVPAGPESIAPVPAGPQPAEPAPAADQPAATPGPQPAEPTPIAGQPAATPGPQPDGGFWRSDYGRNFRLGFAIWRERPLFGVGAKNFRIACREPQFREFRIGEGCFQHPHNPYLEWLTDAGLVGLGGFLVLLAAWAWEIRSGARRAGGRSFARLGAAIAPVLFLWPIAGSQSLFTNWAGTLFWLAVGLALATAAARTALRPAAAAPAPAASAAAPAAATAPESAR